MKNKILELIKESNNILLLTHENPDGDAIGSLLAFYEMLKSGNKNVDIFLTKVSDNLKFLNNINAIKETTSDNYDLGIVLDCATAERICGGKELLTKCNTTICIDHHISNSNYTDYSYVEGETPSCTQVIYYLFKEWNIDINVKIGNNLAIGLLTDTNGFANNNVNKETYLMAAELMEIGVDIHTLYKNILNKVSVSKFNLTKIVYSRLEFYHDNKVAFSYITKEDFNEFDAKIGDNEGLVNIGRSIEGVEVSIFMKEEENYYRVSFRSNGLVDVNILAQGLNGGGHSMAAGCNLYMSFDEAKDKLLKEVEKYL